MAGLYLLLACAAVPAMADPVADLLGGAGAEDAAPADRVISTENTVNQDARIRDRLAAIYAELAALQGVTVAVKGGVVTLQGEVDSAASESRALQFARQVEGVVEVENRLSINRELQPRLAVTGRRLVALAERTIAGLPLFGMALLIMLAFWMAGRWLASRQALFRRISPNQFIASLWGQVTRLLFLVVGLVVALALLDATALLGTILGAAGIFGLAVGFAVRDTVENYIASILLSLRNPFEVNDFVDIDGHEGNVVSLTARATILLSPDGNHIRIPNATVFKAVIVNFSRHAQRRFDFAVGVDTDQDLAASQALALGALTDTAGVARDPAPLVVVEALGDSNVVLRCYAWVDQRAYGFLKVRSEAIRAVKLAFDRAGIVMPEPVYQVRVSQAPVPAAGTQSGPAEPPIEAGTRPAVPGSAAAGDVSVDRTIADKVVAEKRADPGGDLLSDTAATEY